jgi:hypothetical protein
MQCHSQSVRRVGRAVGAFFSGGVLAVWLWAAPLAHATDYTWPAAVDGTFQDEGNWSSAGPMTTRTGRSSISPGRTQ